MSFSEPINAATFDYHDLALTRSGGTTNLITSAVTVVPLTPANTSFSIGGLAGLTGTDGSYTLTVNATGISDTAAHAGVGSNSATWVMDTVAPQVEGIEQLNDPVRSIVVQSLDVTLSKPIDPTTFDYQDITLTRDSGPNLITSAVTVTQVDDTTYDIENFSFVSGQEGTYTITVQGAGLADLAGNKGTGKVSESWVMDTTPPADATNLAITPDSGASSTDGLTDTGNVTVTGTLPETGLNVRLTDMTTNTELGEATVIGTKFSKPIDLTVAGGHHIRIRLADAAANVTDDFLDVFVDLVPPTIDELSAVSSPRSTPLAAEDITFSEAIDPATFDYRDLALTNDGATVPLTSSVTVVPVAGTTATYRISGLGLHDRNRPYELTVDATGIRDQAGNTGSRSALGRLDHELLPAAGPDEPGNHARHRSLRRRRRHQAPAR